MILVFAIFRSDFKTECLFTDIEPYSNIEQMLCSRENKLK